ncbi:hypothetical protein [Pseudomonas oryzihabitans]|uniref:hypothetical protein n=1 Tax=Pseudomonas oryzihabitans TaxID=47885 RepID=UPI003EB7CB4F
MQRWPCHLLAGAVSAFLARPAHPEWRHASDLAGIPEIGAERDTCLVKNRLFHTANDCSIEREDVVRRQQPFTLILDDLKQRYP